MWRVVSQKSYNCLHHRTAKTLVVSSGSAVMLYSLGVISTPVPYVMYFQSPLRIMYLEVKERGGLDVMKAAENKRFQPGHGQVRAVELRDGGPAGIGQLLALNDRQQALAFQHWKRGVSEE